MRYWSSRPSNHRHLRPFPHGSSSYLPVALPFRRRSGPILCRTRSLTYPIRSIILGSDNSARSLPHRSSYWSGNRRSAAWRYRYPASYRRKFHPHEAIISHPARLSSNQPIRSRLHGDRKSLSLGLPSPCLFLPDTFETRNKSYRNLRPSSYKSRWTRRIPNYSSFPKAHAPLCLRLPIYEASHGLPPSRWIEPRLLPW